jgi:hypothetical protein
MFGKFPITALALLTAVVALYGTNPVWAQQAVTPAQFVAKMYTEALGRIPDVAGWQTYVNLISANGCNLTTLRNVANGFYTSAEFNGLGYSNQAKLLAAYRGVLNREPDLAGFNSHLNLLQQGFAWSTIVSGLTNSPEFATLVNAICASGGTYGFGSQLPMQIPGIGGGETTSLQNLLNAQQSICGTVALPQMSVYLINDTITIPPCVKLTTAGNPSTNQYALMARIVRASNFSAPMVSVSNISRLSNVWVDGRRANLPYTTFAINILASGTTAAEIRNNRVTDSIGWNHIFALGSKDGPACGSAAYIGAYVTHNLVTAYATHNQSGPGNAPRWSDGLAISCDNAEVTDNAIVDATDVSIVLFRTANGLVQVSKVRRNKILNAGNSAYGGIAVDGTNFGGTFSFQGASVDNNIVWTGDPSKIKSPASISIGLAVGTRAWYAGATGTVTSASVTNNSSGGDFLRSNTPILISGATGATVTGNAFIASLVNSTSAGPLACPLVNVARSNNSAYASGALQPSTAFADSAIDGCMP